MTSTVLTADQRRNVVVLNNLGPAANTYAKGPDGAKPGSLVIEKKPIFRSGSFADSNGEYHDWEQIHLSQMVDHWTLLNERGILTDIPIRKYHPDRGSIFSSSARNPMDELVGYITGISTEERKNPVDGQTYTYMLADLEIIEENAKRHVESGLWRNMSAEIGGFVTNNAAEYWPVLRGVAYVDQGAVEGLREHSKSDQSFSLILEDQVTQLTNPNPPAPGTPAAQPPAAPQMFSIAGKPSSDYAAVQAHITKLETQNSDLLQFRQEAQEAGRTNYVDQLVRENKIMAPQADGYKEYAKGLDDKTFEGWKALMDATSPMQITGAQGSNFSQNPDQVQQGDATAERIADLRGMISTHSMNNMPTEKIMLLNSYKELKQLDPSFSL